ncbi:MAG TPA: hypothetical protein VKH15_17505 [Candidatus Acidoferrum sp.]|nr:hypothetical protein [Candidatus Acidoferrum sp.]
MTKKGFYLAGAFALGLAVMGVAYAQRPETDINHDRHSHLADAQKHVVEAYDKVVEAQKDNNDQLGGHAERAIDLLDQANRELKLAAEYSDHHRH